MRAVQRAIIEHHSVHPYEGLHVVPVTDVQEFSNPRIKPLTRLQKLGYSLLAFSLVFISVQAFRCGIVSGIKLSHLLGHLALVKQANQVALTQNTILKDKISLYSSPQGIEEMARERLSMVGPDEVLIRLYPVAVAQR